MSRTPRRERLFQALLRAFPSEFRGDFGDQMTEDFRDQRGDAARKGRAAIVRLWLRTAADFLRRGPREHLDVFIRDAGYGLRLLRRSPAFAASTLLTLAVGIGLNTAVFSIVDAVLVQDLPYPSAERLVRVFELEAPPDRRSGAVSAANFIDWAAATRTLDAVGMFGGSPGILHGDSDPEWIYAMSVSEGLLDTLGARPLLGRLFSAADYEQARAYYRDRDPSQPAGPPAPGAILLSHDQWQRQFRGDPRIIGSQVQFGEATVEIVGVMRPEFGFTDIGWDRAATAWVPETPDPRQRRARYRHVLGRLAPGVSLQEAQAEFDVIAKRLADEYPRANAGRGVLVSTLFDVTVAGARQLLWLLSGAAVCVLLIGCANVANLLLAHSSGRRLELATRIAVGASRGHLVRQTLTEGLVLGCGAGACGFLVAYLAVPSLVQLAPPEIPRLHEIAVDSRVFAFSLFLSVLAGAACGLAACLSLSDVTSARVLRSAGADAAQGGRRLRQTLTVAEIALALILVVAAGLLVRTMRAVGALPLGFDPAKVLSVGMTYNGPQPREFDSELLRRVRAIRGVVAAGIGTPPLGGGMGTMVRLPTEPARELSLGADSVSVGYLEALGGRLVEGRFFEEDDKAEAPPVAVLNQSAARHFWPQESAVGKALVMEPKRLEVVGVIADVRRGDLEAVPEPAVYLPNVQATNFRANNMLVRAEGDPRLLVPDIRAVLRQIDRRQALVRIQTLEERIADATAPRRFVLRLVGAFSIIALGLAVIGVYGIIAESVARRVPEIGIRMALGATARNVTSMILRQGVRMLAFGLVLGIGSAAALRGVMSAFVFGVGTADLPTYAAACLCLTLATILACLIPARRAARIDPVLALRQE